MYWLVYSPPKGSQYPLDLCLTCGHLVENIKEDGTRENPRAPHKLPFFFTLFASYLAKIKGEAQIVLVWCSLTRRPHSLLFRTRPSREGKPTGRIYRRWRLSRPSREMDNQRHVMTLRLQANITYEQRKRLGPRWDQPLLTHPWLRLDPLYMDKRG